MNEATVNDFGLTLRSALPADVDAIAALHAASWRYAYRGALSDEYLAGDIISDRLRLWESRLRHPLDTQHIIVALNGRELAGFACVNTDDDPQWGSLLDNLHVAQSAHRKGIGTKLLNAAARHCATVAPEAGLYLWVLQNNLNAQKFYLAHGAANIGADIWNAPGGTLVPRYRFGWRKLALPVGPGTDSPPSRDEDNRTGR